MGVVGVSCPSEFRSTKASESLGSGELGAVE